MARRFLFKKNQNLGISPDGFKLIGINENNNFVLQDGLSQSTFLQREMVKLGEWDGSFTGWTYSESNFRETLSGNDGWPTWSKTINVAKPIGKRVVDIFPVITSPVSTNLINIQYTGSDTSSFFIHYNSIPTTGDFELYYQDDSFSISSGSIAYNDIENGIILFALSITSGTCSGVLSEGYTIKTPSANNPQITIVYNTTGENIYIDFGSLFETDDVVYFNNSSVGRVKYSSSYSSTEGSVVIAETTTGSTSSATFSNGLYNANTLEGNIESSYIGFTNFGQLVGGQIINTRTSFLNNKIDKPHQLLNWFNFNYLSSFILFGLSIYSLFAIADPTVMLAQSSGWIWKINKDDDHSVDICFVLSRSPFDSLLDVELSGHIDYYIILEDF